jgi:ubiquinone/menaquinone biosynthesis C-methylase UbiE
MGKRISDDENFDFQRVNRPVQEAEGFYTWLAPWYDLLAASEKKYITQGLELLAPAAGEYILEIGFGTGYGQQSLIPAVGSGLSAGVDISSGMVEVARNKLVRGGLAGRMALIRGSALSLPFPPEIFEAAFTAFTLELFDTPLIPVFLSECRRVLKVGGRLVVVAMSQSQSPYLMERIYRGLHDRFPRQLDCRPIPAGKLVASAGFSLQQTREFQMWGLPLKILLARK